MGQSAPPRAPKRTSQPSDQSLPAKVRRLAAALCLLPWLASTPALAQDDAPGGPQVDAPTGSAPPNLLGDLVYTAALDGTARDLIPNAVTAATEAIRVRTPPGAVEFAIQRPGGPAASRTWRAPPLIRYSSELDLAVEPGSDLTINASVRQLADGSREAIWINTQNETMQFLVRDSAGTRTIASLTSPIPLPGLSAGRQFTLTTIADGMHYTLLLDGDPIADLIDDREPALSIPSIGIFGNSGAIRVLGGRFYSLEPPIPTESAMPPFPIPPAVPPVHASPKSRTQTLAPFHQVAPHDTDPALSSVEPAHLAGVAPCAQPRNFLFLYLPGTTAAPPSGQAVLNVAERLCLHAVSLGYPTLQAEAGNDTCYYDRDPDCHEKWHLQKLDGVARSPHMDLGRTDSIENRLAKLLVYLARAYPKENWERYLDGDGVRWQDVIAGGMSQGAAQAAIIAKVHTVARVAMLGGVADFLFGNITGPAPNWLAKPGATPPERYFAFANMFDEWWAPEQKSWAALGLPQFGDIVNVDVATPPYGGSHTLTTAVPYDSTDPGGAHLTVNAATPSTSRYAANFSAAWEYVIAPG